MSTVEGETKTFLGFHRAGHMQSEELMILGLWQDTDSVRTRIDGSSHIEGWIRSRRFSSRSTGPLPLHHIPVALPSLQTFPRHRMLGILPLSPRSSHATTPIHNPNLPTAFLLSTRGRCHACTILPQMHDTHHVQSPGAAHRSFVSDSHTPAAMLYSDTDLVSCAIAF